MLYVCDRDHPLDRSRIAVADTSRGFAETPDIFLGGAICSASNPSLRRRQEHALKLHLIVRFVSVRPVPTESTFQILIEFADDKPCPRHHGRAPLSVRLCRLPSWRPSKPAGFVGLYNSNFDRQRGSLAINNL